MQSNICYLASVIYTASVARHIYLRPAAGVGALQKIYGGKPYSSYMAQLLVEWSDAYWLLAKAQVLSALKFSGNYALNKTLYLTFNRLHLVTDLNFFLDVYGHFICKSVVLISVTWSNIRCGCIITGRKRRGAAPAKYVKASSSVTRHVLQQLEVVKILEQDEDNG